MKYAGVEEFIQDMKDFMDVEFNYKGKSYSICPINNKFVAGEAFQEEVEFDTIEELLDHFMLEGRPLREILLEVDVTMR